MAHQKTLNPEQLHRKVTDPQLKENETNDKHEQSHSNAMECEYCSSVQLSRGTLSYKNDVRCIHRLPEVLIITGLGRSTLYARIKEGLFVPPIHLGGRAVGWPSYELDKLLQAMISGSSNKGLKALVECLISARKDGFANNIRGVEYERQ